MRFLEWVCDVSICGCGFIGGSNLAFLPIGFMIGRVCGFMAIKKICVRLVLA